MFAAFIRGSGPRIGLLWLAAILQGCLLPTAKTPESVLIADRQRTEAMVAADPIALERTLHEELSYAHSNGRVDSKPDLIDALVSGRVDYVAIDAQNPRVRVHGAAAILTAPVRLEVIADGETHRLSSIYTAVYCFEEGRWQLAAYHSSPVASD